MPRKPNLVDLMILAGATAYLALSPIRSWFRIPPATRLGLEVPAVRFDGWGAPATRTAVVLAAVAVAWALFRSLRGLRTQGGLDAFLGAMGALLTALALVLPPPAAGGRPGPGWALAAAAAAAAIWAAGGILLWRGLRRDATAAERGTGFGLP